MAMAALPSSTPHAPLPGDLDVQQEMPPSLSCCLKSNVMMRRQNSTRPVRGISVLDFLRLGHGVHKRSTYMEEAEQIALHGQSQCLDEKKMKYFLSHTWRSRAILKHLAVLYSMNAKLAVIGGNAAAFVTFLTIISLRFGAGTMPPVVTVPQWLLPSPGEQHEPLQMSFFCVIIGCVVQLLLLLFGHYVNPSSREEQVFYDKVCICQHDQEQKRDGIFAIGKVLQKTEQLVILWDADYFERLWCTYEVAAFSRQNRLENVTIMPLVLSTYATSMFLLVAVSTCLLLAIVNVFDQYVVVPEQWSLTCYFLFYIFGGTVLYWIPKYTGASLLMEAQEQLRAQLRTFSVKDAKVHDEKDREFVEAEIEAWFGSLEEFNHKVRSEVEPMVMKAMGGQWYSLPYFALIFENTSIFWILVFDAIAVAPGLSTASKLLVLGLGEHLVLIPLYVFISNIYYRWVMMSDFSKLVRVLLNGLWMLLVGCWLPAWMFLATELQAGWSALLLSPGAAAVAFITLRHRFSCHLFRKGQVNSMASIPSKQVDPELAF